MGSNQPIGVFDSGLGGLTIMRELIKALPNEDILYFGDTARLPYGAKSPETIVRYSMEIADYLIGMGVKMIVVACNTASSQALEELQNHYSLPVVGVIAPGAESAFMTTLNRKIGVLGTKGTIRSQSYQKAIGSLLPDAVVYPVECPLFVPLVEEDYQATPAAKLITQDYLASLSNAGVDTVLLGCTHYPMMRDVIEEVLGKGVAIVDSGGACAASVAALLKELGLEKGDVVVGEHRFCVSDDPEKFRTLGQAFLGQPIHSVEHVAQALSI